MHFLLSTNRLLKINNTAVIDKLAYFGPAPLKIVDTKLQMCKFERVKMKRRIMVNDISGCMDMPKRDLFLSSWWLKSRWRRRDCGQSQCSIISLDHLCDTRTYHKQVEEDSTMQQPAYIAGQAQTTICTRPLPTPPVDFFYVFIPIGWKTEPKLAYTIKFINKNTQWLHNSIFTTLWNNQ